MLIRRVSTLSVDVVGACASKDTALAVDKSSDAAKKVAGTIRGGLMTDSLDENRDKLMRSGSHYYG